MGRHRITQQKGQDQTQHMGVPAYLSISSDCIGCCQKWEIALTAVHFFYISDAKRLNVDTLNVNAYNFHGYLLYNDLGSMLSTIQGHHQQRQRHRLVSVVCINHNNVSSQCFTESQNS